MYDSILVAVRPSKFHVFLRISGAFYYYTARFALAKGEILWLADLIRSFI